MIINCDGYQYIFEELEIEFLDRNLDSVYLRKTALVRNVINNRSLRNIYDIIMTDFQNYLDYSIGNFLSILQAQNYELFSEFLNDYGNQSFCKFRLNNHLKEKGLYCFSIDGNIKYLGRCVNNFGKRINAGYGNISPTNCLKYGTVTNCRINSFINMALSNNSIIKFGVLLMDNIQEIQDLERKILERNNYDWNIR